MTGILQQQHITDKIEAGRVEAWVSTSRGVHGVVNMAFRFVGRFHAANIRSVNREACGDFDERLCKVRSREVPRVTVTLCQDAEQPAEVSHLDREQSGHDQFFPLIQHVFIDKLSAEKSKINLFDLSRPLWMNK